MVKIKYRKTPTREEVALTDRNDDHDDDEEFDEYPNNDDLQTIDDEEDEEEDESEDAIDYESYDEEEVKPKPSKIQKILKRRQHKHNRPVEYAVLNVDEEEEDSDEDNERRKLNMDNILTSSESYNCCFGYCRWQRYHPVVCVLVILSIGLFLAAIAVGFVYDTPDYIWTYTNMARDKKFQMEGKALEETTVPYNLTEVCATNHISTSTGEKECKDACKVASCCTSSKKRDNCFLQHVFACSKFTPCASLLEYGSGPYSSLPAAPPHLDTICELENIKESSESYEICTAACEVASCCTTTTEKKNCFLENVFTCMGYVSCDVLLSVSLSTVEDTEIMSDAITLIADVSGACDEMNVMGKTGRMECEQLCRQRECCFIEKSMISNCYDDNNVWCDELEPCLNLDVLQPVKILPESEPEYPTIAPTEKTITKTKSAAASSNEDSIELIAPTQGLKVICSPDYISIPEGKQECIESCQISSCCIQPLDSSKSCLRDNVPTCEEYFHCCEDVYDFVSLDDDDDNDDAFMEYDTNPTNSEDYTPPTFIEVAHAPSYLNKVCSTDSIEETDEGEELCNELCLPAFECCLNKKINCNYEDVCDSYQNCYNVWEEDGYLNTEDIDLQTDNFIKEDVVTAPPSKEEEEPEMIMGDDNGYLDDIMVTAGEENYDATYEDDLMISNVDESDLDGDANADEEDYNSADKEEEGETPEIDETMNEEEAFHDIHDEEEEFQNIYDDLVSEDYATPTNDTDISSDIDKEQEQVEIDNKENEDDTDYEAVDTNEMNTEDEIFLSDTKMAKEEMLQEQQAASKSSAASNIPNPPSYLSDACDSTNMNTDDGKAICSQLCSPASKCCTTTNLATSCNSYDPVCKLYEPCLLIWFKEGYFSTDTDTTTTANEDNESSSLNKEQTEEEQEHPKTTDTDNNNSIPNPSNNVTDAVMSDEDEKNEEEEIITSSPTVSDNKTTPPSKEEKAKEKDNDNKSQTEPPKQKPVSKIKIPNPSSELADYCELETVKQDEDSFDLCINMCQPAFKCCTKEVEDDTACNKKLEVCTQYQPCHNVWIQQDDSAEQPLKETGNITASEQQHILDTINTSNTPEKKETLSQVCTPTNLGAEPGRIKCETECHPGLCCIGIRGDCSSNASDICDTIFSNPCRRIWMVLGYYNDDITPINLDSKQGQEKEKADTDISVVETLCSQESQKTNTGKRACTDVCNNWNCCWLTGDDACYAQYELECNAHLICDWS